MSTKCDVLRLAQGEEAGAPASSRVPQHGSSTSSATRQLWVWDMHQGRRVGVLTPELIGGLRLWLWSPIAVGQAASRSQAAPLDTVNRDAS